MQAQVITMSSKGQIVLPAEIRQKLGLKAGSKLAVYADEDAIVLKPVRLPEEEEFEEMLRKIRSWVEEEDFTEEDVKRIIAEYRRNK